MWLKKLTGLISGYYSEANGFGDKNITIRKSYYNKKNLIFKNR